MASFTGMLRKIIELRLGKPASRVMSKEIIYMMARHPEKVRKFMDALKPVRDALNAAPKGDTNE